MPKPEKPVGSARDGATALRERAWGGATALFDTARKLGWVDLLFVLGVVGLLVGLIDVAREWVGVYRPATEIDLSPSALPLYTFFSLSRGLLDSVALALAP